MYQKHEGRWVETLQSHNHHSDPALILETNKEQAAKAYARLAPVDIVALPQDGFRRAYVNRIYSFM